MGWYPVGLQSVGRFNLLQKVSIPTLGGGIPVPPGVLDGIRPGGDKVIAPNNNDNDSAVAEGDIFLSQGPIDPTRILVVEADRLARGLPLWLIGSNTPRAGHTSRHAGVWMAEPPSPFTQRVAKNGDTLPIPLEAKGGGESGTFGSLLTGQFGKAVISMVRLFGGKERALTLLEARGDVSLEHATSIGTGGTRGGYIRDAIDAYLEALGIVNPGGKGKMPQADEERKAVLRLILKMVKAMRVKGDNEAAISWLDDAEVIARRLRSQKDLVSVARTKGELLELLGREGEAIATYQKVVSMDDLDMEAREPFLVRAARLLSHGSRHGEAATLYIELALNAVRMGDLDKASVYIANLKYELSEVGGWVGLAEAMSKLGEELYVVGRSGSHVNNRVLSEAGRVFAESASAYLHSGEDAKAFSKAYDAIKRSVTLSVIGGDIRDAITRLEAFMRGIEGVPHGVLLSPDIRSMIAILYDRLGDWRMAGEVAIQAGEEYEGIGNYEKAVGAFQDAERYLIKANSRRRTSDAMNKRAKVLRLVGRTEEALKIEQDAAQLREEASESSRVLAERMVGLITQGEVRTQMLLRLAEGVSSGRATPDDFNALIRGIASFLNVRENQVILALAERQGPVWEKIYNIFQFRPSVDLEVLSEVANTALHAVRK